MKRTSLTVVSPGLLSTIQDLGRFGFAHFGVPAAGAADQVALRLGNVLVGNPQGSAAIEMTLTGGTFSVDARTLVAITGSDFQASISGRMIDPWRSVIVQPGEAISFAATRGGARSYLCIQGGIAVEPVMGSRSTHVAGGFGGLDGRPLRRGDVVPIGDRASTVISELRRVRPEVVEYLSRRSPVCVTAGPQISSFPAGGIDRLCTNELTVREESNRMGVRLTAPNPLPVPPEEMITEGVSAGAIQVPRDGNPIVLLVEHPTTGGYPKIANVTTADMHRMGQLRPRDAVHFELVDVDKARAALEELESMISESSLSAI